MIYHIILLIILTLPACGSGGNAPSKESQAGTPAPLFELGEIGGGTISLEGLKGQVVLIRFWNTQCKSCREEMPKVDTFYRKFRDSGMTLLAVNAGDTPEKISRFMKGLDLTFPVLMDRGKEVAKKYLVFGVPTSFIVDREGIIRKRFFGDLSAGEMEGLVRPLL